MSDTSDQSDTQLAEAYRELAYQARSGMAINRLIPPTFRLIRQAVRHQFGFEPHRVQLVGGAILANGGLAEMATGEGKTLTALLPLAVAALRGRGVHLATANDYLAERDAETARSVLGRLGLSVGVVLAKQKPAERRAAYAADVTYGTLREFAFDYLRDRLKERRTRRTSEPESAPRQGSDDSAGGTRDGRLDLLGLTDELSVESDPRSAGPVRPATAPGGDACRSCDDDQPVMRGLMSLVLDEADALLIDEARTPLIVSEAPTDDPLHASESILWAKHLAETLTLGRDVTIDFGKRTIRLTPGGRLAIRLAARTGPPVTLPPHALFGLVERAVRARHLLERDRDYLVLDGKIQLIDPTTGRPADGRQLQQGLHQAVEAIEAVRITPVIRASARITTREIVARYEQVAGMTGTAWSERRELKRVFGLRVTRIPTHRPCRRVTLPARIVDDATIKRRAVAAETEAMLAAGRAVLIGVATIDQAQAISRTLTEHRIPHRTLTAHDLASEADRIAEAGRVGAVTVATDLAGRGTDIHLAPEVAAAGGLHVIVTELHDSARVDRQLIGRSARQGDPGSSRVIVAWTDELLRGGRDQRTTPPAETRPSRASGSLASGSRAGIERIDRSHGRAIRPPWFVRLGRRLPRNLATGVILTKAQHRQEALARRERAAMRRHRDDEIKLYKTLGLDPLLDLWDDGRS